ncbi:GGDEF domain-containing protein [Niveispirillum sp. KHB5.9]|uniref:GGDEF domain-containing protein n=1 Tax=Niveispirillum sp. KHB5.9 TaxID=3400269 RepID=UPI003A89A905
MSPFDAVQTRPMTKSRGLDRAMSFPPQPSSAANSLQSLARAVAGGLGGAVSPDLGPVSLPADTYVYLLQDTIMRLREAEAKITEQKERIEHLETLSMTDELTSLLNRRGFVDAFGRELASSRRNGVGGVLVIIDLDGFKAINDTHGHLCGDWYLRQVARTLKENVRAHDIVARFGGDEFAVLLTDTDQAQGMARADALSAIFNAAICQWQMLELPLRGSFGTQAYGPGDQEEDVIRRADAGMYRAKRQAKAAR